MNKKDIEAAIESLEACSDWYNDKLGVKRTKTILSCLKNALKDHIANGGKMVEPVDVDALYLNEQVGGAAIARLGGVQHAASYNKAIDHLHAQGLLRTTPALDALRNGDE